LGKRSRKTREAREAAAAPAPPAPAAGPLPDSAWPAAVVAAGVAAVALGVYLRTLAPTVTLVDSGELALAARDLGVAHPPGMPLWVMLAHLATLVPWSNVAARVAASSALFAALAAGVMVLLAREALLLVFGRPGRASGAAPAWIGLMPPTLAGLAFAFSRSLWSYATVVEVYTLNILLIAGVLGLLLRWGRRGGDTLLYSAAVLFGLALGVHHATVALTLPALAVIVYRAAGAGFFRGRRFAIAGMAATLSMIAVYAYLPWAASRRPLFNWGNPSSLERIVWHVTGRQYQAYFEASSQAVAKEVGGFVLLALRQFGPPWLPVILLLALIGVARLWNRDRILLLALVLLLFTNLAFGVAYVIGEDKDAYYLASFLALTLAAAFGTQAVLAWAGRRARAAAAALAFLPALPLAANHAYTDHSRYFIAEDYVANALAAVAPGGMLLTGDWQLYSPLLYATQVEGRRPDVVAIDLNLLRRSWYLGYLERRFPETIVRARTPFDAFAQELTAWEHDPDLYARSPDLTRRISGRFQALLRALLDTHTAPVYATRDGVLPGFGTDIEVPRTLTHGRALVPRGLLFELARQRPTEPPPAVPLRMRGLFDGTMRFEADDVVAIKVRPVYLAMIATRGAYLEAAGDHRGAAAAFEEAVTLDPSFAPARAALERNRRPQEPSRPVPPRN
jgi:transmembrane protein TMEM260 (protein O-mannosyltransferase)